MSYADFIDRKRRIWGGLGHDGAVALSPMLHDWQAAIVRWGLRKGRCAFFCDTGLVLQFMNESHKR